MQLVPDNPPVRGCLSNCQKVRHRRAYQRSPQTYASITWYSRWDSHPRPYDMAAYSAAELQECVPRQNGDKTNACRHLGKGEKKEKKGLSCILLGRLSPCRPIYQEVSHSGLTHPVSAMG